MSLSRKIAAALDTGLEPADLPCQVAVVNGRHRLSLDLTVSSTVGVAFDTLAFSHVEDFDYPSPALRAWADRLAARVTYLMEPLVVLELDTIAGEAELRSQSPTARGDSKAYYEVRLGKTGMLRLSRVIFDEGTRRRRPAPCQMTCEVLERLTDDLVSTAG